MLVDLIAPDNLLALGLAGAFALSLTLFVSAKDLEGRHRRQVLVNATLCGCLAVLFGSLMVVGTGAA
jgi:hypothetical protein